jgi:hypothetical protein
VSAGRVRFVEEGLTAVLKNSGRFARHVGKATATALLGRVSERRKLGMLRRLRHLTSRRAAAAGLLRDLAALVEDAAVGQAFHQFDLLHDRIIAPDLEKRQSRRAAVSGYKRQLILDAARFFSEEGLEGASLRAIAVRAGYTPAALYFHFESKEALYAEVLQASLVALGATVDWAVGANQNGRAEAEGGGDVIPPVLCREPARP